MIQIGFVNLSDCLIKQLIQKIWFKRMTHSWIGHFMAINTPRKAKVNVMIYMN